MSSKRKEEKRQRLELNCAVSEIIGLQSSLDQAYTQFNSTADKDALDACIFEISALRSRYNTALKHYKRNSK